MYKRQSLVYSDRYKINDDVFISKKVNKNGDITGNITGLKRDKYIVTVSYTHLDVYKRQVIQR